MQPVQANYVMTCVAQMLMFKMRGFPRAVLLALHPTSPLNQAIRERTDRFRCKSYANIGLLCTHHQLWCTSNFVHYNLLTW